MLTLVGLLPLITAALTLLNNVLENEPAVVKVAGWLVFWNGWKAIFLPLLPADEQALLLSLEKQMVGSIAAVPAAPVPPAPAA